MTKYDLLSSATAPITLRVIPELAEEIGLNASLMLLQLAFWIRISDNERDGKYWTYQSLRGMKRTAFPFWSLMTIDRAINQLEKRELIFVRGDLNKRKGDNTRWFALNPDGLAKLHSVSLQELTNRRTQRVSQIDTPLSQVDTPVSQNETTLPEITPENTQRGEQPLLVVVEKARPNVYTMYEKAFGLSITGVIGEELRDLADTYGEEWVNDALKLSVTSGHRSLSYTKGILRNWQANGRDDKRQAEQPAINPAAERAALEAAERARIEWERERAAEWAQAAGGER